METETKGVQMPDVWFNPVRVKAEEGQILVVKQSSPDGPLEGFIHSIKDHHFRWEEQVSDPDNWTGSQIDMWDILPNIDGAGRQIFTPREKQMPEEQWGWVWVGFGKALGEITIRQAKWEIPKGGTTAQMVNKERREKSIFYHHVLGIVMEDIESKGNFENTIRLNLTVKIENPYKALYLAGGWESTLDGAVHGAIRDYISDMPADEIRAERENGGMKRRVMELNEDLDGFFTKFGIRIYDLRFVSWETTNPDKAAEDALRLEEVNRLRANAAVERAREIMTIANAEADAAALKDRKAVEAFNGDVAAAAQVRAAEVIAAAIPPGASVVVIGGQSVPIAIPLPGKKP